MTVAIKDNPLIHLLKSEFPQVFTPKTESTQWSHNPGKITVSFFILSCRWRLGHKNQLPEHLKFTGRHDSSAQIAHWRVQFTKRSGDITENCLCFEFFQALILFGAVNLEGFIVLVINCYSSKFPCRFSPASVLISDRCDFWVYILFPTSLLELSFLFKYLLISYVYVFFFIIFFYFSLTRTYQSNQ